jgi:rfaE bifunctional protein kinase chain/domain
MKAERFQAITQRYPALRVALVGDFCLDRYLEIDPGRAEVSIETGLPVHNVVRVRSQPGAAGTILNNLVALGVGTVFPVGSAGEDGEGYELRRALDCLPGVKLDHFQISAERRTFTYCKPLVLEPGKPPRELNRLDSKNWTPTPPPLRETFAASVRRLVDQVDAVIVLDQVDVAHTGVITPEVLNALAELAATRPNLPLIADSRRGLAGFPRLDFKMNLNELGAFLGQVPPAEPPAIGALAEQLAQRQQRRIFVTLSERGIIGAAPHRPAIHAPALPVAGAIDIVGAGDAVTANLAVSLAAGAELREALELAMAAASVVIHQLGTTGTASVEQLQSSLFGLC